MVAPAVLSLEGPPRGAPPCEHTATTTTNCYGTPVIMQGMGRTAPPRRQQQQQEQEQEQGGAVAREQPPHRRFTVTHAPLTLQQPPLNNPSAQNQSIKSLFST